jgi:2-polyprenyl-6-methoxyphenol hydroxylase-like FAD-dependent oxidoreductase
LVGAIHELPLPKGIASSCDPKIKIRREDKNMETVINTDVIIVGAGPTGLSLACQLVRYGIDFVIIEKKAGVTTHSKALGVQARTMEIYEQLGVAQQALDLGQIAGKIRIITDGKVRGGVDLAAMGEGLSPYPYLFILEQNENEQLLYEYLQSHDREVRWQTELEYFTQTEQSVTARITTADGGSETIEAKYLVGCDGARSPVRTALGLTFEGSTLERIFYVADAQIDWEFGHDAGYGCLSRDSETLFFPMVGENRYRIIGTFPEDFDKPASEIPYTEIEQQIENDTKLDLDLSDVNWFSVYKVNSRAVNQFSVGRCFVAGDAAHIHSPAGGQGMNTGIQDVYNLAWKMAFVIKGYAGAKLLATYNEERLPNAQRLLETTDRAFDMMVGSHWFYSFLRTTIFPLVAKYAMGRDLVGKSIFSMMSQIRINYRDATLSKHDGAEDFKVKAGDRMPYFLIDGESIYDQLHTPKFHLLVFSNSEDWSRDLQRELEEESVDVIEFKVIPLNPQISAIFGTNRPFQLLLRPDNYIGFISTAASLTDLRTYIHDVVGYPRTTISTNLLIKSNLINTQYHDF